MRMYPQYIPCLTRLCAFLQLASIMAMAKNLMTAMADFLKTANQGDVVACFVWDLLGGCLPWDPGGICGYRQHVHQYIVVIHIYIYYIYIHTHSWIVGTSPTTIGGMGIVETSRQMFGGPKESMVSIAPAWMIHHIRRLWSVAGQVWQGIRTIFPECFSPHFFRLSCLLRFIISIYRLKFTLW